VARIIDARGLDCPQPVVLTKRAMDEAGGEDLLTLVNTDIALENVSKLAHSQGYQVEVEHQGNDYHIHMSRQSHATESSAIGDGQVAVLVTSNLFGQGEAELGQVLMKSFLVSLNELSQLNEMVFMNSGVYLTTEGSPVLEILRALEAKGVQIYSCGTCLDYYQLKDKLKVGQVTNMYSAMEILTGASKCITI
jgi:selenium metabolism protein YedF